MHILPKLCAVYAIQCLQKKEKWIVSEMERNVRHRSDDSRLSLAIEHGTSHSRFVFWFRNLHAIIDSGNPLGKQWERQLPRQMEEETRQIHWKTSQKSKILS